VKYQRCEHIKKSDDVTSTVYCCDQCASKIMEVQPASLQQTNGAGPAEITPTECFHIWAGPLLDVRCIKCGISSHSA